MKVYHTERVMVVLTGVPGLHAPSRNRKTGPMAQAWVLPTDAPPNTPDGTIACCGDCPLALHNSKACYVTEFMAPLSIWKTYKDAPVTTPDKVPHLGTGLRVTAFGDPAFAPLNLWQELLARTPFHTGYTHQWKNLNPAEWGWLMASVDTRAELELAQSLGWNTYRAILPGDRRDHEHEGLLCPAYSRDKETCYTCRLCSGTGSTVTGIFAPAHGPLVHDKVQERYHEALEAPKADL